MLRMIICMGLFAGWSAIALGQEIIEIDAEVRDNTIEINRVALSMMEEGNHQGAYRILQPLIEADPTFHPSYMNLYRAGSQIPDKAEEVVEVLRKGLAMFEEDDEMAYYLGNILQKNQRYSEAILAYSDAIAFSKKNGEDFPLVWAYHFNRGNCLLKIGQFEKAIPDYAYALTLSPDNPDVLTNRGFCYLKTNNPQAACKDWQAAYGLGQVQTSKYLESFCK